MNKMFMVNGKRMSTWNPLGGECSHKCSYCWARKRIEEFNMEKYHGEPRLVMKELNKRFSPDAYYFVQDMSDLFADNVPWDAIQIILNKIRDNREIEFLLLTKNPDRYMEFIDEIPLNCTLGTTIETNRDTDGYSHAPRPYDRWFSFSQLKAFGHKRMISIEPIMDLDINHMVGMIGSIMPNFIYVGYDNYNCYLPEPSLSKTYDLINQLKEFTEVRIKTLR